MLKEKRRISAIFNIRKLDEDRLFELLNTIQMDFKEIAFIDKNEGFEDRHHIHQWFDISFVMKGSLQYEIGENIYSVSEGDVIVIAPGKSHKEICDPESDFEVLFVCVDFTKNGKQFNIAQYLTISEVTKINNPKGMRRIFECILSEVTYRDHGYLLKIKAELYNLLVMLYRNESRMSDKTSDIKKISAVRKQKVIDSIKEYMNQNFGQKISLDDLSKVFYLSPPYISSLFKKQTDRTPVEYLNMIRIEKAKEIFMSGETNISKVADIVGISDVHYFYKVFRQFENKTPIQFITWKNESE